MEQRAQHEDEKWSEVIGQLDLLFAKVGNIENHQHKFEARFDMSNGVLEQMLRDQQKLAKQMEITGQPVEQLTLNQMDSRHVPTSPTHSEVHMGHHGRHTRPPEGGRDISFTIEIRVEVDCTRGGGGVPTQDVLPKV